MNESALQGVTQSQGLTAFSDFWNLVALSGPLRWPIFAVLALGLALAIAKFYELRRDQSLAGDLRALDVRGMDLGQLVASVSNQPETSLSSLQSTMLNVFQTRANESTLHDEIANFIAFQKDLFERFRRRMDFLADTAGALGLLGTVWGMFEVFFQGTPDRDMILRGMGIALMTTLLGLVASIVINLATTELYSLFGRQLDQVSRKSDVLRFRLLELAHGDQGASTSTDRGERSARPRSADPVVPAASSSRRAPASSADAPSSSPGSASPGSAATAARPADWCEIEIPQGSREVAAGEVARGIELILRSRSGRLPDGVGVLLSGPAGHAGLGDGNDELRLSPGEDGVVRFDWLAPPAAGSYLLDASVVGHAGASRRLEFRVPPGPPHKLDAEGNHQAAVAGMRLASPLGVRVRDRFDNPVPGVAVTFRVKSGGGRLGQHGASAELRTDASGAARAPFAVASEAGPNVVTAMVEGRDAIEFVAFGTAG